MVVTEGRSGTSSEGGAEETRARDWRDDESEGGGKSGLLGSTTWNMKFNISALQPPKEVIECAASLSIHNHGDMP